MPLITSCGQSQGKPASGSSARTSTSERCASHAAKPQLKLLQKCQYYSCCFCLHVIATKSGSVLQLSWFGSPSEILARIQTVFSCYNRKVCLDGFTGPFLVLFVLFLGDVWHSPVLSRAGLQQFMSFRQTFSLSVMKSFAAIGGKADLECRPICSLITFRGNIPFLPGRQAWRQKIIIFYEIFR